VQQNCHSTRRTLARLPFADHMNRFIASEGASSGPKRSEMLTRVDPSLDRAVVLFQNIVQILYGTVLAILLKGTFDFEPHDRGWVGGVLVSINNPRLGMVRTSQSFTQEALCCSRVLSGRRTERVYRTIQVAPLALEPDVGLIHRQLPLVGLSFERKRRSISGA
jgi:hypothetical protein